MRIIFKYPFIEVDFKECARKAVYAKIVNCDAGTGQSSKFRQNLKYSLSWDLYVALVELA